MVTVAEFEMKYIHVMPPEFHQWNAQRKAYQNLSPAEKRRRLRANKDGYEDGGSDRPDGKCRPRFACLI